MLHKLLFKAVLLKKLTVQESKVCFIVQHQLLVANESLAGTYLVQPAHSVKAWTLETVLLRSEQDSIRRATRKRFFFEFRFYWSSAGILLPDVFKLSIKSVKTA